MPLEVNGGMSKRRIIISDHARKRLRERVVDPYNDSYRRMVAYAWNKGKTPESIRKKNPDVAKLVLSHTYAGGSKVLKIYGNYVFLFSCKRTKRRTIQDTGDNKARLGNIHGDISGSDHRDQQYQAGAGGS